MKTLDEILAEIALDNRATAERLAKTFADTKDLEDFLRSALDALEDHGPKIVRLAIVLSGVL